MLENGPLVEKRKNLFMCFWWEMEHLVCVFLVGNGEIGYRVNSEAISSYVSGRK